MNYILFDDSTRYRLLPFTHTRPIADVRCGILTMRERWELCLEKAGCKYAIHAHSGGKLATSTFTMPYLQHEYPLRTGKENIYINATVFASIALGKAIAGLQPGQCLVQGYTVIAAHLPAYAHDVYSLTEFCQALPAQHFEGDIHLLKNVWDLFAANDRALRDDFALVTDGRVSAPIPEGVWVTGAENLFIEEGSHIYAGCVINAATGPVYIGRDTEVLEGVMVRGPLSVNEHSVIKMGAKIYGATTLGPGSKVGGEINNAVFFANSNKSHDGYLGNAVIGEWCNLGADTNCSNLKNNYGEVKIWDEALGKAVATGLTFCGLLMADHSKCGINTMFNTGTIVGVSCNIFGGGFPEKFIPSFSWGVSDGAMLYEFDKAMETANRMMARRARKLSPEAVETLRYVFENHRIR